MVVSEKKMGENEPQTTMEELSEVEDDARAVHARHMRTTRGHVSCTGQRQKKLGLFLAPVSPVHDCDLSIQAVGLCLD